jgi:hypothetical protein
MPGGKILPMPSKFTLVVVTFGAWTGLATAQQPDPLPMLQARLDRLGAHIESIESVRAIKRVQYAYGHYVELGLWNDFADLFTDDAVTNYQSGVRGRDAIRKLFFEQVGQGKLGLAEGRIYPHILFQPVITLAPDGRTAKGRWRILAMLGGYGSSATWYSGVYENEYILDSGTWKIKLLHSEPKVTAAYTAPGWKDSGVHVPFHYTSESVRAPIPDLANARPKAASVKNSSLASLANRVNELARRAARLNDQANVTNLQNTYGYAVDRKLWDQVADLFAKDGTLELGLQGVYVGKASIRRALSQFGPQGLRPGELNDHVYLETLVSVAPDEHTANARGIELIMSSTPAGQNGELSEGIFENTFIKQGDVWKIQSVHYYPRMILDAAVGWAKSAKRAPAPSKEFPPDRPPTTSYEIYPKFAVAPFHFDNPVTGKPPQYPAGIASTEKSATAVAAVPREPTIRNAADLQTRLAELERTLTVAEAYDAAENLIAAYSYYLDESPTDVASLFARNVQDEGRSRSIASGTTIFVNQILQPVIDIAPDGKSAKVRARLLDLGGTSGGVGNWTAGTFEGQVALEERIWKFQMARSSAVWSAAYPGGWAKVP